MQTQVKKQIKTRRWRTEVGFISGFLEFTSKFPLLPPFLCVEDFGIR